MNDRDKYIEDKQDMTVLLDPEIAAILQKSTSVSIAKGNSHNLFKVSTLCEKVQTINVIFLPKFSNQQSEDGRKLR